MTQPPGPAENPDDRHSREPDPHRSDPGDHHSGPDDHRSDPDGSDPHGFNTLGFDVRGPDARPWPSRARWILAGIVLVAFAALLAVRVTSFGGLDQTSLFYVGVPALLALLVVLCVRASSAVGVAMAVTTVALLLAGPLLGEGVVCLVISAPLIYGVVSLVTWLGVLVFRPPGRSTHALVAVPLLFALALEGVGGFSLLPRENTGEGSVIVDASPDRVAAALADPPAYDSPRALFLTAVPFPKPVAASGAGLAEGDTRTVHFTPRRVFAFGAEPTPRHMELEVAESEVRSDGGRVVFDVTADTTFDNWMDMNRAVATWEASSEGTVLTWEIEYERTYDPSWYFGPVQSYATDLAAEYLAETFAEAAR